MEYNYNPMKHFNNLFKYLVDVRIRKMYKLKFYSIIVNPLIFYYYIWKLKRSGVIKQLRELEEISSYINEKYMGTYDYYSGKILEFSYSIGRHLFTIEGYNGQMYGDKEQLALCIDIWDGGIKTSSNFKYLFSDKGKATMYGFDNLKNINIHEYLAQHIEDRNILGKPSILDKEYKLFRRRQILRNIKK